MTGRERMKAAMKKQKTDCVPVMPQICHSHAASLFYDDYQTGVLEIIKNPQLAWDLMLKAADFYDVDGLRLFLAGEPHETRIEADDIIALHPETGERVGKVDLLGGGWVVPDEPIYPISSSDDLKAIPRVKTEELLQTQMYSNFRDAVEKAHPKYFVAGAPTGFTLNYLGDRRGKQQALLDLVLEPELSKQIMDVALENSIEVAKALVKCGVDVLYIGDPSSSGSLISPAHFEEYCLPRLQAFCDELHREDILIYLHICGNTNPIMEMMAATGADCIEPLDPLGGVDVGDAKKRVGDKVALMGGVNTLTLLNGTPETVREEATRCCQLGGENGGYILAAGDMVPDLSPAENVKALIATAREHTY